jgi:putative spermidine/putrescine transport system permease protein
MDLGANGLQTFRYVLLPELRSALVAGALLAFALSWDEVIVTIFTAGGNTTIPIWIWTGLRTGGNGSEINVVAAVVVLLSIVPVYFAQRLTTGGDGRAAALEEPGTLTAVAASQGP